MDAEAKAYNALNIAHLTNRNKLQRARQSAHSWQNASLPAGVAIDRERQWQRLTACGVSLALETDPHFPPLLREIVNAPLGIYTKGAPLNHAAVTIAIVGTRKATNQGTEIARAFGKELAESGITVISGLALGIDAAAHEGALAGNGTTVAVLANGLDAVYPKQNERLAYSIITSGGTLVSEYPLGAPSLPERFLERNRIISGLCRAVIVIEAPERSGSLATAAYALEQNREIFVVPGPMSPPNYPGSHELIKAGAALITGIGDVLKALNLEPATHARRAAKNAQALDADEQAVFNALQAAAEPLGADAIATTCALPIETINRTLGLLAVRGVVSERGGNYTVA